MSLEFECEGSGASTGAGEGWVPALVDTVGRPSFRERARQLREAEILNTARRLFGERNFHDVSMDEVAERVGISKATLYQHFPSKEDLALRVIGHQMDRFIEHLERVQDGPGSPRARLEGVLRRLVELRHGVGATGRTPCGGGPELGLDAPQLLQLFKSRPEFIARHERIKHLMARLIEQGQAAGEINPALPVWIISASFFSLVVSHNYRAFLGQPNTTLDQLADYLSTIFFAGVAGKVDRR